MGVLLSAQEIVDKIDRAGNHDGIATLEDIRPHLNADHKIPLDIADDFHLALQSLNRVCKQGAEIFNVPAILCCPAIQNGRIEPEVLKKRGDDFILTQFNRLFENPQSDNLIRGRYKEFLSFVLANRVPLSELFHVLQNYPSLKNHLVENAFLEEASVQIQSETLVQLSWYSAMWHLKYNVKAFVPEELAKYPPWLSKKISGFEDNILERLRCWELSVEIGDKDTDKLSYYPVTKKMCTPAFDPFPSFLNGLLGAMWHESFHAYQTQHFVATPRWTLERDACLVEAIAHLKMERITDSDDERLKILLQNTIKTFLDRAPSVQQKDEGMLQSNFESYFVIYRYALLLSQPGSQKNADISREAFEKDIVTQISNHLMGQALQKYLVVENGRSMQPQEAISRTIADIEKDRINLKRKSYRWPPGNEKGEMVSFLVMLGRMNQLLAGYQNGIESPEAFLVFRPYLLDIIAYGKGIVAKENCKLMSAKLEKEDPAWTWTSVSELVQSQAFVQKYKWVFWNQHFLSK